MAFSLLSLPGTFSNSLKLPGIASVWALKAPCTTKGSTGVCSEFWVPAGAAVDTEQITIFQNAGAEGNCSGPAPVACFGGLNTDLTDSPISQVGVLNDSSVYITQSVGGGTGGQFAYLSNWQRVINDETAGIPNFFTWLDAYSPSPNLPLTVRQAFATPAHSVNPYIASTAHDFYIVGNVYDSLETVNPLGHAQLLDWMVVSSSQTPLSNSQLTYTPPAGTVGTYRFSLRSDLFFQDGFKASAFDVAFSYLSLIANGAYQAQFASKFTGITVLSPVQFDISVNSTTFTTKPNLTSLTIIPGRYWTGIGSSAWDKAISSCVTINAQCYPAQYTLGPTPPTGPRQVQCVMTCTFAASNLNADPMKTSPAFDPILNHDLVGSGPWSCGPVTTAGSGTCTSSGNMNPPLGGTYTLTRFGAGLVPASSVSGDYFRSSGNLALWIWSGDNGDITHDFLNVAAAMGCFGLPIQTTGPCVHFQQGMGANGTVSIVQLAQISIVIRFFGVNWTSPFPWQTNPPTGIWPFPGPNPPPPPPLILYSGSYTLNPSSVVGCPGGYDC